MVNNPLAGLQYLIDGFKFLFKPGIRLFVIIPLMINLLIFGTATAVMIFFLSSWIDAMMAYLPEWLNFLKSIVWLIVGSVILLVTFFSFSMLANLIASPFNGLLAEQVEWIKTGEKMPDSSFKQLLASIPKSLSREVVKMIWYLPWFFLLSICSFIPVINAFSGILWFVFSAWVMAIQYADYPCDNHQRPFKAVREDLKRCRFTGLGFGSAVAFLTMIPFINLLVMPAAICGGTLLYLDNLRDAP